MAPPPGTKVAFSTQATPAEGSGVVLTRTATPAIWKLEDDTSTASTCVST